MRRFLDTNVLVKALEGNPGFLVQDGDVTSAMNLLEMHVVVARLYGEPEADRALQAFRRLSVGPDDLDIREASRLKREHRKRGLSYIDALGYSMARNRSLTFVTTDSGFRGLESVDLRGSGA